jgi:hypothetical protein
MPMSLGRATKFRRRTPARRANVPQVASLNALDLNFLDTYRRMRFDERANPRRAVIIRPTLLLHSFKYLWAREMK